MLSKGVRPQNPAQHLRGSSRRCSGAGQDRGVQAIMPRQETCRDAVCAFEAYPAARPAAIARAMRCPVRVHVGSDCAEPSQACQVGRPATTTRPCVLCVTLQASVKSSVSRPAQSSGWQRTASTNGISRPAPSVCRLLQQNRRKADVGETRTFGSPSALMGYARQVVVAVERRVSAATGYMTVTKIIVSSFVSLS